MKSERINGMFVPTNSDSRYCVIALDIDWYNETVLREQFYDLGIQPKVPSFYTKG